MASAVAGTEGEKDQMARSCALDFRKKTRLHRMMRSNSFEVQEVREMGRKQPDELKGFSILWIGTIKEDFLVDRKNAHTWKN